MSGAVYELLLRHPHLFDEQTLVIGAGAELAAGWPDLLKNSGSQLLTWDLLTARAYQAAGAQCRFALPQPDDLARAGRVILLWPKAKALALALTGLIASRRTQCWIAGANDAGGKSVGKACQALASSTEKTDSARHCSLWQLTLNSSTGFNWLKQAASFPYDGQSYMTLPGVFSHGTLDQGTALLLEHVPAPAHGRLLDLGCGSGVIGLSMKAREPALDVTLADIDAFAIRSSQLNSARLNLPADILASDGLADISGSFDYIFSNPPFHLGKDTNYSFARNLFRQGRQHLTMGGQLWIVANRHLPYEEWAQEEFADVQILAQENGFKLLCIQNQSR